MRALMTKKLLSSGTNTGALHAIMSEASGEVVASVQILEALY